MPHVAAMRRLPLIGTLAAAVRGASVAEAGSDGGGNRINGNNISWPEVLGPFLVWADGAYSKYESRAFDYSRHVVGGPEIHGCCASHVHVLWERRHDETHSVDTRYPLVVAVPNFVCNPEALVDAAVEQVRVCCCYLSRCPRSQLAR